MLMFLHFAFAQNPDKRIEPDYIQNAALLDGKNIVKVNPLMLPFGTVLGGYERILNKRLSLVADVTYNPSGKIPMVGFMENQYKLIVGDEYDDVAHGAVFDAIGNVRIHQLSFSPALRIYLGKGYGRGFYFAPYFHYEKAGIENFDFTAYEKEDDGSYSSGRAEANGHLTSNSLGLMMGAQWLLGKKKNIALDWNILGTHAGLANSYLYLKVHDLSLEDINNTQELINEIKADYNTLPFFEIQGGEVKSDGSVDFDIKSPWAFFRASITIGYRF